MNNRILIIDDDPDTLDILEMVFIHQAYQVNICNYSSDIDGLFLKKKPDLVIVGFLRQEINEGAYIKLRKAKDTKNVPVILLSGYPEALGTPGDYVFMMKSFNLFSLSGKVKRMIGAGKIN